MVQGDFSRIGLPDIDATNVTEIIGKSNGRGIYVIFDADGSIMENFFGVGPNVLGISSPQFSIEGTTIITESWTVLNGAAVDPNDREPTGAAPLISRASPPTSSDTPSDWPTLRPTARRISIPIRWARRAAPACPTLPT